MPGGSGGLGVNLPLMTLTTRQLMRSGGSLLMATNNPPESPNCCPSCCWDCGDCFFNRCATLNIAMDMSVADAAVNLCGGDGIRWEDLDPSYPGLRTQTALVLNLSTTLTTWSGGTLGPERTDTVPYGWILQWDGSTTLSDSTVVSITVQYHCKTADDPVDIPNPGFVVSLSYNLGATLNTVLIPIFDLCAAGGGGAGAPALPPIAITDCPSGTAVATQMYVSTAGRAFLATGTITITLNDNDCVCGANIEAVAGEPDLMRRPQAVAPVAPGATVAPGASPAPTKIIKPKIVKQDCGCSRKSNKNK